MLFFDFLIALVARGWYFFMRKGLRRKPALVWLTMLSLLVEVTFCTLFVVILFKKIGIITALLAILLIFYSLFLLFCVHMVYLTRISRAYLATYEQNRKLFATCVVVIAVFVLLCISLEDYTIVDAFVITSCAISCVIYVGNMLPDEPPKRKKEKKVAIGTELPDPGSAG